MASPSKEDCVLELILENSPLREWHFDEIVREADVSRAVAAKWLGRFVKYGMLKRVKQRKRFPHFTAGRGNAVYQARKRLYALERMQKSGLLAVLTSLESARTVIIFGSMARGDWYRDSDVDVFVLGEPGAFDKSIYERRLNRNIELHVFASRQEMKRVQTGLLENVVNGYLVKGSIQDVMRVP